MADHKGAGSTRNKKDSESKRLGVKISDGQEAIAGNIIIRQRGTVYLCSEGTEIGKDHTIFATKDGVVYFFKSKARKSKNKNNKVKTFAAVISKEEYKLKFKSAVENKSH